VSLKKIARPIALALSLLIFYGLGPANAEEAPSIEQINAGSVAVVEGDQVSITGRHFGKQKKAELVLWTNTEIVVRVPLFPSIHEINSEEKITLRVIEGEGRQEAERETSLKIFNRSPLLDLLELKSHGLSEEFILDQFDKMNVNGMSGNRDFNGIELIRLKAAGFNDDTIASLARTVSICRSVLRASGSRKQKT